jgi:hypothetical protein
MSTEIERLLYSERQYLRSFDFTAEQTYHLEMRRRLNLALHLWGIVHGLELLQGDVVQGAQKQWYLSEGMAIDAYGREIIVSAKHLLSDDLHTNLITGAGTYSVWIGYKREPAMPPEAGYQHCDLKDQFTRWRESFEIRIFGLTAANPNPSEDPDPFGDLPDDAKKNDAEKFTWLIHLGTINVDRPGTIAKATNENRIYVGIRTQRIVAPRHATPDFHVLGFSPIQANDPLKPLTSIAVTDNLFLEQNLIAGQDFVVDSAKIQPPAPASPFPNPAGNVKIASDLFLQGNLYTHCDPTDPQQWLNLDQCIRERIKNSVPEVHIGAATVTFSAVPLTEGDKSTTLSKRSDDVKIATQLAHVEKHKVITSIAGVVWKPKQQVPTPSGPQLASAGHMSVLPEGFQIDTTAEVRLLSDSPGTYSVSLICTAGPIRQTKKSSDAPPQFEVPIDSVSISYVVIFYPKT